MCGRSTVAAALLALALGSPVLCASVPLRPSDAARAVFAGGRYQTDPPLRPAESAEEPPTRAEAKPENGTGDPGSTLDREGQKDSSSGGSAGQEDGDPAGNPSGQAPPGAASGERGSPDGGRSAVLPPPVAEVPDLLPTVPPVAAKIGRAFFFALGAVAGILLVVWIVDAVAGNRGARRSGSTSVLLKPVEKERQASATAVEAERLAAQGLYGEAVHALLSAAIERLFSRSRSGAPPAATARELLDRLSKHSEVRSAFATLVAASEGYLFGGAVLGRAEYEEGLAAFARVVPGGGS